MNKWVKCNERLPDIGRIVLVRAIQKTMTLSGKFMPREKIKFCRLTEKGYFYPYPEGIGFFKEEVTHWIDIPLIEEEIENASD